MVPLIAWLRACPRPERFSILYFYNINNNTKGRILHNLRASTTKRVVVSPSFWLAKYQASTKCRAMNNFVVVVVVVVLADAINPLQSLHLGQY